MSFVDVALIAGGGALLGGVLQSQASKGAAATQSGALNNATQSQQQMFNTVNQQQAPYRQAGYKALAQLNTGFGTGSAPGGQPPGKTAKLIGNQFFDAETGAYLGRYGMDKGYETPEAALSTFTGYSNAVDGSGNTVVGLPPQAASGDGSVGGINSGQFTHQFDANDLKTNLAPNYAFMLGQGQQATTNLANMGGGVVSGNTLKAINDYTQNYAGNAYQNAFQNYNTNQTNIYNRLASIAGLGQTAGSNSSTGASSFSSGIAGTTAAAGASQAAGQIGSANALAGGANNAMGWYGAGSYLNNQQSPANNNMQWIEQPQQSP